ncbi:MAG: hypothetical protein HQL53_07330 [Magnetococcales bacterium]|nr:hypothetical protein [Magnetococcales bacterium]
MKDQTATERMTPQGTRLQIREIQNPMAVSLHEASDQLFGWMQAENKVQEGDVYMITGRRLTRRNLKEIRARVKFWNNMLMRLASQEPGWVRGPIGRA